MLELNVFITFISGLIKTYEVVSQLRNKKCGFTTDQFFLFCFLLWAPSDH